jgi:hypothetical protein
MGPSFYQCGKQALPKYVEVPISTTMAKPLLQYYQEVLSKISHADRAVFRKELRKAFRKLEPAERGQLKEWFRASCVCRIEEPDPSGLAADRG